MAKRSDPIRLLGRPVVAGVRWSGEVALLLARSLGELGRGRFDRSEVARQAFEVGNRSLLFVMVTMAFIGMIMVLQACFQAERLIGDFSLVGPGYLQLLVREFAPTIGAMMIATRVGAGIAAELGSMAVTEQLDALRLSGVDPVSELVVPRVLACAVMVPSLVLLAGFGAEVSGLLTARMSFGVPTNVFWSLRLISFGDVIVGLTKAVAYAWVIPVTSARAGMAARGGSAGVGDATTRAVIDTSLSIILLDFALNVAMYPLYQRGA